MGLAVRTREISKEIYDNAIKNNNRITSNDLSKVFFIHELCGYGIYSDYVFTEDDKYFVKYNIGTSCD